MRVSLHICGYIVVNTCFTWIHRCHFLKQSVSPGRASRWNRAIRFSKSSVDAVKAVWFIIYVSTQSRSIVATLLSIYRYPYNFFVLTLCGFIGQFKKQLLSSTRYDMQLSCSHFRDQYILSILRQMQHTLVAVAGLCASAFFNPRTYTCLRDEFAVCQCGQTEYIPALIGSRPACRRICVKNETM